MELQELTISNIHHLGKGIRKPRFRKASVNSVKNRILMSVLYGSNTKLSELAEVIGVSSRSVTAWVYERNPGDVNRMKIADVMGFPENILFYDHCGAEEIEVPFETRVHLGFLGEKIQNVILAGLMIVHDINHPDLAEHLGYNRRLFAAHIHDGRIPPDEVQAKVSKFFRIPTNIIYNPDLFAKVHFTAKEFKPYIRRSNQE